jgi:UDP-N-acetylmuramate dehydrogenase
MTWQEGVPLAPWTTLRSGGPAELFATARTREELIELVQDTHRSAHPLTLLGWGSNVLPSSRGVLGRVLVNQAEEIEISQDGTVTASSGIAFQKLFLKTAQAGLSGLEFAVGVPGTLGGALVSNAGAYRGSIANLVAELEVINDGELLKAPPEIMQFSYRDSLLRRPNPPKLIVTQVSLKLTPGDPRRIYDIARENQRQRIGKQPPPPSAGSFFKNVNDRALAESLASLPDGLKNAGVVPAGYLIEAVGLKGARFRNCGFHSRHANFIVNLGGAAPESIRLLADHAKKRVYEVFGVGIEEEALYLGDWSGWQATGDLSPA